MESKISQYLDSCRGPEKEIMNRQNEIWFYIEIVTPLLNAVHGRDFSSRFWFMNLSGYISQIIRGEKYNVPQITANKRWRNYGILRNILFYLDQNKVSKKMRFSEDINTALEKSDSIIIGNRAGFIQKDVQGVISRNEFPSWFFRRQDKSKRSELLGFGSSSSDEILKKILRGIPKLYLEFFESYTCLIPLHNPRSKVFHCEQGLGPYLLLLISYYVENGARLKYYQPGGWMGDVKYNNGYLGQLNSADEFVTYGWKLNPKDKPGKAYRIIEFIENYKRQSTRVYDFDNSLLIVLTNLTIKNRSYISNALKKIELNLYLKKFRSITVRYRPKSRKLKIGADKTFKLEHYKRFKWSNGISPMYEEVKNANLVIQLEHPATNFLECIGIDKPVMAVLTNNDPTEIIIKYYNFFLEEGVLHLSIDELIRFLNSLENIEKWWCNVISKEGYTNFKKEFVNIS